MRTGEPAYLRESREGAHGHGVIFERRQYNVWDSFDLLLCSLSSALSRVNSPSPSDSVPTPSTF